MLRIKDNYFFKLSIRKKKSYKYNEEKSKN